MNKNYLILLYFFFSCSPSVNKQSSESVPPNEYLTVIVINETTHPIRVFTEPSYLKPDSFSQIAYRPLDTLHLILLPFEEVLFSHKNVLIDKVFVGRGDTLILHSNLEEIEPTVSHWNSSIQGWMTTYTDHQQSATVKNLSEQIDSIYSVFHAVDKSRPFYVVTEYEKKVGYRYLNNDESRFETKQELIQQYYRLSREKYESTLSFLELARQEAPEKLISAWRSIADRDYYDELNKLNATSSPVYNPELLAQMNAEFFQAEDILLHPYSRKFLIDYAYKNTQNRNANGTPLRGHALHTATYDLVEQLFKDLEVIKYLRYLLILNMADQQDSFRSIEKKFEQFKDAYPNDQLVNILQRKYLFDFEKYAQLSDDLQLIDGGRALTTLQTLLEQSKGNLLYVDIWASWCVPCRMAMPASRQLKKDYEKSNINFAYLSTDQNIDAWKQAVKAELLDNYKFNYLIINQDASDFLTEIELTTIPRYLLFGSDGKLLHQNAPGPDSPELIALLDNYLK